MNMSGHLLDRIISEARSSSIHLMAVAVREYGLGADD